MKSHTRLLTVLDRMDNGPVMEEKDFDKLLSKTVRKLIKKYELCAYDGNDAILTDDDMADRFFQAGLELACTTGVYCTDTHTQLLFSEEWAKEIGADGYSNDANEAVELCKKLMA